jgi:hypothetical protein
MRPGVYWRMFCACLGMRWVLCPSRGVHAPLEDRAATVLRRHLYSLSLTKALFLLAKYVFLFQGLADWVRSHVWTGTLAESLSLEELGVAASGGTNLQLQLLDTVVLLLAAVFQRRALGYRAAAGSAAAGSGGAAAAAGGGRAAGGKGQAVGTHYVSLLEEPLLGQQGPRDLSGSPVDRSRAGSGGSDTLAGAGPSPQGWLYTAWLCGWYFGAPHLLLVVVLLVGVVRPSLFGILFLLGGVVKVVRCDRAE